jgi:hypothetical protein
MLKRDNVPADVARELVAELHEGHARRPHVAAHGPVTASAGRAQPVGAPCVTSVGCDVDGSTRRGFNPTRVP